VQSFDDSLDSVAKFANNDTEYGLQASIWTRSLRVAHTLARKIKVGTICVNAHNYGDPACPLGGFKQSGWDRETGKEVMEHDTETKSVAVTLPESQLSLGVGEERSSPTPCGPRRPSLNQRRRR
jgi:phenylacetaldehyde dehydrogenase